jgi:hypothetical protein
VQQAHQAAQFPIHQAVRVQPHQSQVHLSLMQVAVAGVIKTKAVQFLQAGQAAVVMAQQAR